MLANKLMKKDDYSTDFETRTLELLKLRFAESELHHCDVMLKDMQVRAVNSVFVLANILVSSPGFIIFIITRRVCEQDQTIPTS